MPSISSPGIGSGLDINNIVTELVAAERKSFDDKFTALQQKYTDKISGIGKLKSALSEFEKVLYGIKLPTAFSKRKVDTSSTYFTATAGSAAVVANYDVKVNSIAKAQRLLSSPFADEDVLVGKGDMTIALGNGKSIGISVSATDTLKDLQTKINEASLASKSGISATLVTGDDGTHLVFSSEHTGDDGVITVSVTDDDGNASDNAGLSRFAFDYHKTVVGTNFTAGETINSNGDLQLSVGGVTANISVTSTDSIENVRDAINAAGLPVSAALVDDGLGNLSLELTTTNGYKDSQVTLTALTDDDGNTGDALGLSRLASTGSYRNFSEIDRASNASITINGSVTATSSSNKFSDVIAGVELNVTKAHGTADPDNIKISLDTQGTKDSLTELVEKYNLVMDEVKSLTKATGSTSTSGVLVGDNVLRTMTNQMQNILASNVDVGNNESLSLSTIGISFDRNGYLTLDTSKLDTAITNNFDKFSTLFTGENGISKILHGVVKNYESTKGILDTKVDNLNNDSKRLDEEKVEYDKKMVSYEQRLFAKFNSMDLIVANLRATGDYLTAQLSALSGSNKK